MISKLALPSAPAAAACHTTRMVWFACLLLPWLNPFAGGPSSWVVPWLFSAACAVLFFGVARPALPHPGVLAMLAGLAVWGVLRSGWSPPSLALAAACLLVCMMAGVAASDAQRPMLLRTVALSWLLAAVASTAAALLQYFGLADLPLVNATVAGEAFGNLRQRNQFASLTAMGMAALFWLVPQGLRRWQAVLAMACLAVGNAATTSRTGLLQLLLLGVLAWCWPGSRRARGKLWLIGLASYGLAAVALPWALQAATGEEGAHLWDRVSGIEQCSSRLALWSNVLHLVAQRPWLGWGWGELDFAHYITLYPATRFCDILDNAHDLPLHLAVELGLPAAVAVFAIAVAAATRAKPWRERHPDRQMAWAVLLLIAVHSLVEYPLWYGPFEIALGLCLGLLWPRESAPQRLPSVAGTLAARVLAAGALVTCGCAAWDYHLASQIYLPPERRSPAWRDDPLARLGDPWLFRDQVRFAELTLTPLTRNNALWMFETATALVHYSPEPRVIEKLIESATLLGREREALLHLARFRAAFPEAYSAWSAASRTQPAR